MRRRRSYRCSAARPRGRSRRARSSRRCRLLGLSAPGRPTAPRICRRVRQGLNETGYVEGQNVTIEYPLGDKIRSAARVDGRSGSPPVDAIVTPANAPVVAAKATRRFLSSSASPKTRSGLVLSQASPGRAAT